MDYLFRKAERKDLKEVIALYQEAIVDMTEKHIFQWDEIYPSAEVLTEDIENGEMYLLIKEGRIASCVVINEDQDESYLEAHWSYNEGSCAVIHRLCVHPKEQSCGIGKQTMKATESWIKEHGYSNIRLDAFSENPSANRLYHGLSYRFVGNVRFRKGLFYLMEKSLTD